MPPSSERKIMSRTTAAADLTRRRQALFLGLSGTLDDAQTQVGLRLWDQGYAQNRPAAIIEFVAELSTQLGLPPKQRHEMRMAIYQALLKYDAGREPLPGPSAANSAAASVAAPATVKPALRGSAAFIVFAHLLQSLLDGLRNADAVAKHDLIQSLQRLGPRSGLDLAQHHALTQWAKEGAALNVFSGASEPALALAVHTVYVGLCEALGPVATDQLLARAVRAAEALPEAPRFPPQRLL
jgi:hypothetical protein